MKILLVSATEFEISGFKSNSVFDVLITGVGVPGTIFNLQKKLLSNKDYSHVLQIGFGGVHKVALESNDWELGDMIAIGKDAFGDIGAMEQSGFRSVTDMGLSHQNNWLENTNIEQLNDKKLPLGNAITCNTITDNIEIITKQYNYWHADIESMEGAALHFVCNEYNIPYLQIRALTNIIGDRNKGNWKIKPALDSIIHLLESY